SDMGALASMLRGTPASSEQIVDEQAQGGMGAPATINAPARPGGQIDPSMLGQLRTPEMQNTGMQMFLQQMARENAPPERVDLGDRIGLVKNGQIVGYLPKGATPDATMREGGAQARHATPSGGNLLSAQTALQTHATPSGSTLASNAVSMRGQNMTDARAQQTLAQGKTPPGYRGTEEGNLQAIPGGPADTKLAGVLNQDTGILTSSTANMDRLATAANEAMNHPGLAGTAGLRGAIPNVPGTQAADAAALLNTLKSQVAFGVLQDMRNNSKTGGALGNVSDAEGRRLEANLAALEKSQSVEQLKESLKKIIDYTEGAKGRLREAFNLKHSGKAAAPSYAGPERRATSNPTATGQNGQKLELVNGQWQPVK
ncbi:MAG: hypothetical protein Q7J84_00050, partial [Sulfuricaulis sp.]|nr:hypothetical protein [Sulfuricaulis sp.]